MALVVLSDGEVIVAGVGYGDTTAHTLVQKWQHRGALFCRDVKQCKIWILCWNWLGRRHRKQN